MISIAVVDVLFLVVFALFLVSTLNRVGVLPIEVVAVDDHTFCIVICNPFSAITVASVVNPVKDLLAAILRCLVDAAIIVVSMILLWILESAASSGCLAVVLYNAPGPLVLASPRPTSHVLALVPYVKASLKRSQEEPSSTCRALVLYTGNRASTTTAVSRPMTPMLAITGTEDEISMPSLVLNASISTAPSSPCPATPNLLSSLRLSGPKLTGKQQCEMVVSSSSLSSSPTLRQLQTPSYPVPLIGDNERAIAMLIKVNGRSKFSDFPINDLIVERQLGQGGFGTVLLTRDQATGQQFAVKRIEKYEDPQKAALQKRYILNEIEAQSTMSKHPAYFVELHGAYQTRTHYLLIMPFCGRGDLEAWLQREKRFSVERTVIIVAQIVHMISLMAEQGILHRDLKPGNILIDGDDYVRASDFGLCHRYACIPRRDLYKDIFFELSEGVGTPAYAPPEMFSGHTYNRWVDLYSLGLMTYDMLTGELPERDLLETSAGDVLCHPDLDNIHPRHLQYLDYDALDFIKTLLYNPYEPYRRTTISRVKAHPFLRDAPWYEIENEMPFTTV